MTLVLGGIYMCVGAHLLEGCQSLHGGVKIGLSDGQSFIRQGCERRDPRSENSKDKEGALWSVFGE